MEKMNQIVCLTHDGRFEVNNDIMKFRKSDFSALEALFQTPKRSNQTHIFAIHENIAAALQDVTEKVIIHLASRLQKVTKNKNICLAGGVSLNCVANGKILPNTSFENIFIQPAANDAGTSIGAACYIWNQKLKKPRCKPLKHTYFGPDYSDETIQQTLELHHLLYQKIESFESNIAQMISQGNIVAWFDGRMEAGPRALGRRSILGDPRSPIIRDVLNNKVKYREIFRPFCPSVLKEDAREWFEMDQYDDPAHYMLIAYKVRKEKAALIPAVMHIDRTARIQLVTKETNPRYYKLIVEFKRQTGIPIVLNTSFNIQEPIVCSPEDAINTFKRSHIDCLVMGNFLLKKQNSIDYNVFQ